MNDAEDELKCCPCLNICLYLSLVRLVNVHSARQENCYLHKSWKLFSPSPEYLENYIPLYKKLKMELKTHRRNGFKVLKNPFNSKIYNIIILNEWEI